MNLFNIRIPCSSKLRRPAPSAWACDISALRHVFRTTTRAARPCSPCASPTVLPWRPPLNHMKARDGLRADARPCGTSPPSRFCALGIACSAAGGTGGLRHAVDRGQRPRCRLRMCRPGRPHAHELYRHHQGAVQEPISACLPRLARFGRRFLPGRMPRHGELGLDAPLKLATSLPPNNRARSGTGNDLLLRNSGTGRSRHDRGHPHQCRPRQRLDLPQAAHLLQARRPHHGDRQRRQPPISQSVLSTLTEGSKTRPPAKSRR